MHELQRAAAKRLLERRKARERFTDFCRYVAPDEPPAQHHELICDACDEVVAGELRNLLVFMPPGSAKSTYASVRLPAYYLGRQPEKSVIAASYGEGLATSFGRKVRNLVSTREYGAVFDARLAQDAQAKGEWETQDGGSYFAVGVGSGVTGRRADLGLIDDPVKGREAADSEREREKIWQWYLSDFSTRLKPGAAQIIIQTRWHFDDLAGRIIPDWDGESGDYEGFDGQMWRVVCLPAQAGPRDVLGRKPGEWLWLDWFDEAFWEETRKRQTDVRNWSSLYQQTPQPDGGTYFRREWFQRYTVGDQPKRLSVYGASDYAVTGEGGDYTEHGIGGFDEGEALWFLDWWSGQTEPDQWIESELDLAKQHDPLLWVAEGGVIRRAVAPFLRRQIKERKQYLRTEWLTSSANKAANARSFQALAASGQVWIPKTQWSDELIEQLVAFPAGKYDDKVDVCGLFGRLLEQAYGPRGEESQDEPETDAWGRPREASNWKTG